MKRFVSFLLSAIVLLASVLMFTGAVADPQTKTINLSAENISYEISDKLYGVFLEDISFAGDGGGFAGTIQAFVPNEILADYKSAMESIFGEGSCYVLIIRPVGGVEV